MEQTDSARTDENVFPSRRRLSSILKAPRSSIRVSDPEQAERKVEVPKTVEKRNSRRVSFAPANDVLLFSNDVKNGSPVSPLQALSVSTIENVDKRFQVGNSEDGVQPITGMETLLNAPLQISHHKNKENFVVSCPTSDDYRDKTVIFNEEDTASMDMTRNHTKICVSNAQLHSIRPGQTETRQNALEDFGEKTMIFGGDDTGSMDITHSHTIIIANDADSHAVLQGQTCDMPTYGNGDFLFSLEKRKFEGSAPPKNKSLSVRNLDPDFQNFLASISTPGSPKVNPPMAHVMQGATPSPEEKIDRKGFLAQLNMRRSVVNKENQVPALMSNVTEKSQSKILKSLASVSSSNRSVLFAEDNADMDMTEAHTGHIVGHTSAHDPLQGLFPTSEFYDQSGHRSQQNTALCGSKVQAHTKCDLNDMEITKSQTVSTDSKSHSLELSSLSKNRSMLNQMVPPITKNLAVSQEFCNEDRISCKEKQARCDTSVSEFDDMELTRSQTVEINTKSLHTPDPSQNKRRKSLAFMTVPSKAGHVSVDQDGMAISSDQISLTSGSRMSASSSGRQFPQVKHKINSTVNQMEDSFEDMELTRSQTVAIDTENLHRSYTSSNKPRKSLAFMTASSKAGDVLDDECGMDITKSLTVSIDHISHPRESMKSNPLDSLFPHASHKMETPNRTKSNPDDMEFTQSQTVVIEGSDLVAKQAWRDGNGGPVGVEFGTTKGYNQTEDMELTRSQTVAIDTKNLHEVEPFKNKNRKSLAFMRASSKASNVPEVECGVDTTESLTVPMDHISHSSDLKMRTSSSPLDDLFPQTSYKIEMLDRTSSTGHISHTGDSRKSTNPLSCQFSQVNHKIESSVNQTEASFDDMELTRSQTVAIDTKSLHTVEPLLNSQSKSLGFKTVSNKTGAVSEEECGMEMTEALAVSIDMSRSSGSRLLTNPSGHQFPGTDHKIESKVHKMDTSFEDMELTRSQTVAIDTKVLETVNPSSGTKRKSLAVSRNTSNISEDDCGMDMTKALTVTIDQISHMGDPRMSDKPLSFQFPQINQNTDLSQNQMEAGFEDMELTRSQTVAIDTKNLHVTNPLLNKKRKSIASMRDISKAMNVLEDECDMDMTKSLTVSIDHISHSSGSIKSSNPLDGLFPQTSHKMETLKRTSSTCHISHTGDSRSANPSGCQFPQVNHKIESSVNQTEASFDDMELTRSQTVAIDTKSLHTVEPLLNSQRKSLGFKTVSNKTRAVSEEECGMEMTEALAVSIDMSRSNGSRLLVNPSGSQFPGTNCEIESARNKMDTSFDDMELTRSQTVAIDTKGLETANPLSGTKRKSLAFLTAPSNTSNISEDDCGMDMTKALTVTIDQISQIDGSRMSANALHQPQTNHKFESSFQKSKADYSDMEFTINETMVSDEKNLEPLSVPSRRTSSDILPPNKGVMSEEASRMHQITYRGDGTSYGTGSSEPDEMDMTRSQTVAIETNTLLAINSLPNKKRKSLAFMTAGEPGSTLKSNRTLLSEADNVLKMSKAPTTAVEENVDTRVKLPTSESGTVVAEDDLSLKRSHKNYEAFAVESEDMDFTRSQTVVIDSEIPPVGHRVPFGTRVSLPSQCEKPVSLRDVTPLSGEGAHMDTKSQLPDSDVELTRCQTVAIQSQNLDAAAEKSGCLDNFPKTNASLEDASKRAQWSPVHCTESHLTDTTDKIVKVPANLEDTECTTNKIVALQTSHTKLGSFSAGALEEDDEMVLTTTIPVNTEQLGMPKDAPSISGHLMASPDSKEADNQKGPRLQHENIGDVGSPNARPAAEQVDNASATNTKTRRMSLANLQAKLKRVSCMINAENYTAPLSQTEEVVDKDTITTQPLPVEDTEVARMSQIPDINVESDGFTQAEQPSVTPAANRLNRRLTTRLSIGCLMPKLPQRSKSVGQSQVERSRLYPVRSCGTALPMHVTNEQSSPKPLASIQDEVLPNISSDEDLSETLDNKSLQETDGKEIPCQGYDMNVSQDEVFFEASFSSVAQNKKRRLPEDSPEDPLEDEQRRKQTKSNIQEMGPPSETVPCKSNMTAAQSTTQTGNNTGSLCTEATFESTFQRSAFQSQLEDTAEYTEHMGMKLEDESITVSEFFKLFNIDFLIHNSRQSVLPAKLATDTEFQPEDLLRDTHVTRPKQKVYEEDCDSLTEKVEGLKARMRDQEKRLKNINKPLWEAVKTFTEEEMESFGVKLKQRNNLHRRMSKAKSHEMKEVLYTNLLHVSQEEQQKLRGKIEQTDEVLKSLDDCIDELQAELAAVEGTDQADSGPTLKSRQQELENVNRDMADKERTVCEVEIRKRQSEDQINRLRSETRELETHITMLNRLNEWKFQEKTGNSTIYTFLYDTLLLEVVYEQPDGDGLGDENERIISDITFQLILDGDRSECHAQLVHKLLSQYIEEGASWVKKYPTTSYVPKLLHDVSLAVGRCRLLGEEVRRLKQWGALRLDVLDVSCLDTQIRVLFSSLKSFAKFELTIGLTSAYPYCLPQVHSFHSYIGNITIHQLEEIVFSVNPAKNYFTKIIKKIHDTLLC